VSHQMGKGMVKVVFRLIQTLCITPDQMSRSVSGFSHVAPIRTSQKLNSAHDHVNSSFCQIFLAELCFLCRANKNIPAARALHSSNFLGLTT
jgi:hypothetical protein